jgi:hypothetical protein
MSYGERGGALAHLLGEIGGGLDVFLPLLGTSRILTGLEGLAQGEQALRAAEAYTAERRQGRAPGARGPSPLADHPDVRRALRTMSAQVDGMRLLAYTAIVTLDVSRLHPDEAVRRRHAELLDLLAPVVKVWCTELGVELVSESMQLHGGLGYMEEEGLAQCLRDVRAAPIYEGANGVLAAELVRRRLVDAAGQNMVHVLVDEVAEELRFRAGDDDLVGVVCSAVRQAGDEVAGAAAWLIERQKADVAGQRDALAGATAFVRLLGTYLSGWMLARQARAADPTEFRLRAPALVYAQRVLPEVRSLSAQVQAGAAGLFDSEAEVR